MPGGAVQPELPRPRGYPFLPTFWRDIGPYLPPRNGYILLHYTIYFNGHGTTQALTVPLIYFVADAVILGLLDKFRPEAPRPRCPPTSPRAPPSPRPRACHDRLG